MSRPRTVAHRGASALAPENSIRAFELAIEHGLDMAELDVHLSHDGQVMVIHDADLMRVSGKPWRVADALAADLLALGIPRLVDVFDVARDRLGIYVELKGPGTGVVVGGLLNSGAAAGIQVICGSFQPSLVAEVGATAPAIPRSVLFARATIEEMITTCQALDARYAHPCFRPVTAEMVHALHGAGLLVMTPHTNDPHEAQHFAALAVDVIASDDPRVLEALGRAP